MLIVRTVEWGGLGRTRYTKSGIVERFDPMTWDLDKKSQTGRLVVDLIHENICVS